MQRVRQGGQERVRAGRAQRDGAGGPESDFLRQGRRRGGELREGKERGGVVRLVREGGDGGSYRGEQEDELFSSDKATGGLLR